MVRLFHLLKKGNQVLFIICEERIICFGRVNVCAFYENPNRIHTELTFVNITKSHMFLSSAEIS